MELSPRKREILRLVVEEHVASGQPVGSKSLVDRNGLDLSSSTIRSELAELESLGLLTHPHTSAGRVPTETGYGVYAQELVDSIEGRPAPFALDLTAMRNELEAAMQQTTESLSQATRLLALVSAPAVDIAVVRHVEVLQLQPGVVLIVVITATGGITKRLVELDEAVDAGLVEWAREYLNETVAGHRLGAALLRRRFEDPSLAQRERAFLNALRPAVSDVIADTSAQLYIGSAAGLLGDARGAELDAAHRLLELLEQRAAVLKLLTDALDPHRTIVRVGPEVEGAELRDVAYVGSTYGLANRSLGSVALLGPLRMDYEGAIRAVRAAAFELSRLVEEVYESA